MTIEIKPLTCGIRDAMTIAGFNSDSAFLRWAKKVNLASLNKGRYFIEDVRNAVILEAHTARKTRRTRRKVAEQQTNAASTAQVDESKGLTPPD